MMNRFQRVLLLCVLFGATIAGVCAGAGAQVVGLQPTPIGLYSWNNSTGEWDARISTSTLNPVTPTTPQAFALYGFNLTLNQWVPYDNLPIYGSAPPAGGSCGPSNYGQQYSDIQNHIAYFCGNIGWFEPPAQIDCSGGCTVNGPLVSTSTGLFEGGLQGGYTDADTNCQSLTAQLPASVGAGYLPAVGDNSTDNWRSIQTHVEYANSNADPVTGAACVFVPKGHFAYTQPLNMCATLGDDTATCTGSPWPAIRMVGLGPTVSVLAPKLTYPGPALDFGGSGAVYASRLQGVGIIDDAGDATNVGVIGSHGGQNGIAGDGLKLIDDAVILDNSSTPGAVGVLFCSNDTSGVDNLFVHGQGPAIIAGDGLGLGGGTVSFQGSISGTTLTISSMTSGAVGVGSPVIGASPGTVIVGLLTGTGGAGTYTVNNNQTLSTTALTSNIAFSPFYQLAATGSSTECNGNNSFTYFNFGGRNIFVSVSGGTAMQLTGSSAYNGKADSEYLAPKGAQASGHGMLDIIKTNTEGNFLDLHAIREEYPGSSSTVYGVYFIGGQAGGVLTGLLTGTGSGGQANFIGFGCDSSSALGSMDLSIELVGGSSPGTTTFTDCATVRHVRGLVSLSGPSGDQYVPPGYSGTQTDINIDLGGESASAINLGAATLQGVNLNGTGLYNNVEFAAGMGLQAPNESPGSGTVSMSYSPWWVKVFYNPSGSVLSTNVYSGLNPLYSTTSLFEWSLCHGSAVPCNLNLNRVSGNEMTMPGGQVVNSSNWVPVGYAQSWTPAAATASECAEQTVTVTGIATGKIVDVSAPSTLGAHVWIGGARASAANTVAVDFCADATAGTPPSGTWAFRQ